jgi:CheY-like chemotaxis protein
MTDFAQTGEKEIAQEAGCNDYVSKPIKRDQLMGLIQKYFICDRKAQLPFCDLFTSMVN